MKRRLWLVAVLGFSAATSVVGGGGCGGDDGTGGGTPAITPEQACTDYSDAYCDRLESCWPSEMAFLYGDVTTCKVTNPTYCHAAAKLDGFFTDAEGLEGCVAAIKSAACDDIFQSGTFVAGCEDAGEGSLKAGASCDEGYQCDTSVCVGNTSRECGKCAREIAVGGTGCTQQDAICAPGAYCDAISDTCKKQPTLGMPCPEGSVCAGVAYCENGVCGAPLKLGAACVQTSDACDSLAGLFCSNASRCEKYDDRFGRAGDPCGVVGTTLKYCDGATICSTSDGSPGTCRPRAAEGKACKVLQDGGDNCIPGSFCVKGLCGQVEPICK